MYIFYYLLQRFHLWARAISRNDLCLKNVKSYRVCDIHFSEKQKFEAIRHKSNLKVGTLPDVHLSQIESKEYI